jgi:hypothetical protein
MPTYEVDVGGRTFEVDAPDPDTAWQWANMTAQAPAPEPKKSTFMGELQKGFEQPISSMRTAAGALFGSPEEAGVAGVKRGQKISEETGEGPSFAAVKKAYQDKGLLSAAGEAVSQIPRAIAGQGGTMATIAGGARLGAMAGAPVGGVPGAIVGGTLGAAAAAYPMFFGADVERQAGEQLEKGEPVKIDTGKAATAATGQALAESAGQAFVFGKRIVKGVLGIADDAALRTADAELALANKARQSLSGATARGVARGAADIPVEISQQIMERWQAGLPLTDADAMKEYGEAAYLAGLVGGPLGGASSVLERNAARREMARPAPAPVEEPTPRSAKTVAEEFAEEPKARATPLLPAPEAEVPTEGREQVTDREFWAKGPERAETAPEPTPAPTPEPEAEVPTEGREEVTNPLMWAAGPERAADFAAPQAFTAQDILDTGVKLDSSAGWFADNVVGRTADEVQALVDAKPWLIKGNRPQARILRSLLAPSVPAFEEATNVPRAEAPAPKPSAESRRGEPSVGVPSGVTDTGTVGTGDRVRTAPAPTEPVGLGLVPPKQPARKGRAAKVAQPDTLSAPPAAPETPATPVVEPTPAPAVAKTPEAPAPVTTPPALAAPAPTPAPQQFPVLERLNRVAQDLTFPEATRKEAIGLAEVIQKEGGSGPQRVAKKFLEHTDRIRAANERRTQEVKAAPEVVEETADEEATRKREAAEMAERIEAERKRAVEERKRAQAEANIARTEADKAKKEAQEAKGQKTTQDRAVKLATRKDFTLQARHAKHLDDLIKRGEYVEANRVMDMIEQRVSEDRYSQTVSEGRALSPEVVSMLRTDNLIGALDLLSTQGETKLARSLAETLKKLLSKTDVEVVDNLVNDVGVRVRGAARSDGKKIWLDTDTGLDEETLLHEATHAASERVLSANPNTWTDAQRAAVGELNQIWRAAKNDKTINLSEDARESLSEFVTEAMTSLDLQKALAVKPWKKATAWDKFKTNLLRLIGVTDPQSMLDYTIAAMDTIFVPPAPGKEPVKIMSRATKNGQAVLASLGITNPQQAFGTKALYKGMANSDDVSAIDKMRTKVADAAASIDKRIMNEFNGAVRDSLGRLNPMGLYRQAQDYSKMLLAFFKAGSIEKDKTTGLWMVKDTGTTPPAKVLELVQQYADSKQMSFDEAKTAAGRALEAFRLQNLLKDDPYFPNHLTQTELNAGLALYNSDPRFAAMNAAMDASRIELVDHLVAVGRLSADEGKEWKEVIGYVPFDRLESGKFEEHYRRTKNTASRSPLAVTKLPQLVGSEIRSVGDVFENYLNTMGWMVGQVMNTDARNQTLEFLGSIQQAKKLGADSQGKPNVTYSYENGGQIWWQLPSEYDVLAFKAESQTTGRWLQYLSEASNILRTSVTALPPFALKQVVDDIQRALLTSGVQNPLALIGMVLTNFPKIALAEIRGVRHRIVEDAEALGLSGEYDFKAGRPGATFMEDMGYKPRGAFRNLLHRLDGITRASDLAVRKAIYDQTIKESKGDMLLAQTRAREFINFRRRGSSDFVGVMVKTIPFFNAYVQGMDVLYRAASGIDSSASVDRAAARKMFWSRAGIAIALSTVYAMGKADDDEDYNEADLRTRDGNWFIGGQKISVPGELGALFKVIPERVVEYYKRKGTPEEQEAMEAVRTALSYMFEQYVGRVTPVPQAVKPLLEAWTNYSFLTGRELIGIHQKGLDPSLQTRENTSELAIAIANFARDMVGVDKVSPIIVDNILRGYLGSTAALTVMATDGLLNPTRIDRPLHKYALLSNYMIDPIGKRRIAEFYDERDKVGKANATLNEMVARGDLAGAEAYMQKHEQVLMLNTSINATLEQLEQTRAYRKYLNSPEAAAEMSMEERMETRTEVEKMEREIVGWLREAKTMIRKDAG